MQVDSRADNFAFILFEACVLHVVPGTPSVYEVDICFQTKITLDRFSCENKSFVLVGKKKNIFIDLKASVWNY